ncbi:SGNH/GDSL hydrolase family protein [Bacillus cihuensis]|uniref:SGNH/GDSL hydrolase family protein n=1 Tax=Bacillus cihuensis TaxID=1208599 RepID=UPI00042452F0|nr:SGNH/GDSL hydrolase family protein [Bacillus cihuensis]
MKKMVMCLIVASILLFSVGSIKADAAGFVGFGDSNTAGTYFTQYGYDLNTRWVIQTGAINAGISGNDTNQAMKRFTTDVLAKKPTSVSIMFGQNDGLLLNNGKPQVDKVTFEQNITSMVTQLKARNIKVLLMTSLPVQQTLYYNKYPDKKHLYADKGGIRIWLNGYNEIIRKVAKTQNVQLVDHYANAWIKAGGGAGSDAQLVASGLIAPDGFHWTPKGHSMMTYSINYYLAR